MDDIHHEPVYSKKVIEMLTVANEFCLYLEKADEYKMEDILKYLQKLIPIIYLKASLLPEIEVSDDSAAEHFVTEEQWEALFNLLRSKFADDDIYYTLDPHDRNNTDPVRASISEGLADIYQDMKDFILLYQKPFNSSKENAIHECKDLFAKRTGYRLVDLQKAIHYILFQEVEVDEV